MEKAQSLIASASRVYFVPVALMETRFNDIVSYYFYNYLLLLKYVTAFTL